MIGPLPSAARAWQKRGNRAAQALTACRQLRAHLDDELAVSLRALRGQTRAYEDRRWSPGKLEPVADALGRVGNGYLDMLDAVRRA